jgi:hypothetical protein
MRDSLAPAVTLQDEARNFENQEDRMVDTADAAEMVAETHEEHGHDAAQNRFRNRAALLIAVLAAVLAIGGLGGGNATDDMVGENIHASDAWAFYQAKNARQTMYEIAVDDLEARLAGPGVDAATRAGIESRLTRYRATIARYHNEPDRAAPNDPLRGDGLVQLRAQAQAHEAARDQASARDNNFDLAEVFLQLALVLGSVSILAVNRSTFWLAAGLGALGSILTLNGFFLLFPLPL